MTLIGRFKLHFDKKSTFLYDLSSSILTITNFDVFGLMGFGNIKLFFKFFSKFVPLVNVKQRQNFNVCKLCFFLVINVVSFKKNTVYKSTVVVT